ncbi:hypothetical protein JTB14_004349 [Gonioctena quinquepunctata]|nr:hypothetical protein JTB14_004349 [Gonioctena quinquepunctata]
MHSIKQIADKTKDPNGFIVYKQVKKEYGNKLISAKKMAYDDYISSSNNKSEACWKIINSERNKLDVNPTIELSSDEMNNFFSNIADNIINSLSYVANEDLLSFKKFPAPCNSFFFRPVLEIEVLEAINSLKDSKCSDTHELNSRILKETSSIIIQPFTILINLILCTGVFLDIFKFSKVLPLFKKGDAEAIDN